MTSRVWSVLVSCVLAVGPGVAVVGCDSSTGSGPSTGSPRASTVAAELPSSVGQVFEVTDSSTLAAWSRNAEVDSELRLAALRRLEELSSSETLSVATDLTRSDDALLHGNAIAVIVRSKSPEAEATLAALGHDDQQFARALAGGGE